MPLNLLVIVLSLLSLTGCSTFSSSLDDQLSELNHQYDTAPEYARKQLAELKQKNTGDAGPWISSGNWSLKEGDIERAKIAFKQALKLEAKSVDALMGLGICADKKKKHTKAQNYYRQGLEMQPNNSKLLNNYALSYILNKQPLPAIILLEPLVDNKKTKEDLNKKDKNRLLANLSLAYSLNGNLEKAYYIDKELLGESQAQHNRAAAESLSKSIDK